MVSKPKEGEELPHVDPPGFILQGGKYTYCDTDGDNELQHKRPDPPSLCDNKETGAIKRESKLITTLPSPSSKIKNEKKKKKKTKKKKTKKKLTPRNDKEMIPEPHVRKTRVTSNSSRDADSMLRASSDFDIVDYHEMRQRSKVKKEIEEEKTEESEETTERSHETTPRQSIFTWNPVGEPEVQPGAISIAGPGVDDDDDDETRGAEEITALPQFEATLVDAEHGRQEVIQEFIESTITAEAQPLPKDRYRSNPKKAILVDAIIGMLFLLVTVAIIVSVVFTPRQTPSLTISSREQLLQEVDTYLAVRSNESQQLQQPEIGLWDVSAVSNFTNVFCAQRNPLSASFNEDIGIWNLSNATSIHGMFEGAAAFNQNLSSWDTSIVEDMGRAFHMAAAFNQDITSWDTSKVKSMTSTFEDALIFNQHIGGWNVSSVMFMDSMFEFTYAFNQPLNDWDVSSVIEMGYMFYESEAFNQPLGDWNVSSVITIFGMFDSSIAFDHNLCPWGPKLQGRNITMIDKKWPDELVFGNTACRTRAQPDLNASPPGPLCHYCDRDVQPVDDLEAEPES